MKHLLSAITLALYALVLIHVPCLAMDQPALTQNASGQAPAESQERVILKMLETAHKKNDTRTFKELVTKKLKPQALEPIWAELMKMTTFSIPVDTSASQTNPKFAEILNDYNKLLESPLHKAARTGAGALLSKCITKQNINSQNLNGETPLFAAVFNEQLEAARILLAAGADPCIEVSIGMTPLHLSNSVAMTQLLCKHGADSCINKQDAFGQTPIFNAIWEKKVDIATLLVQMGAHVNLTNIIGETILHGTSSNDFLKIGPAVTLSKIVLQAGAHVNAQSNDNRTPLHMAAENKLALLVHLFLMHGADVTLKDRWGRSGASLIQAHWGVTPEEFITLFNQPNFNEIMSARNYALAQKSYEYIPPKQNKGTHKSNPKKNKKKNKNRPTYNQRKEQQATTLKEIQDIQQEDIPSDQESVHPEEPITITPAAKIIIPLLLAPRVTRWWSDEWLSEEKQKAKQSGVYEYWQFLRKRVYHRLPARTLQTLMAYGAQEERPNATHDGHMDTQYVLEGEMQFENLNNPWTPGKLRQPGFYHITRGIDNKIYHVGFKPIQKRGIQLADFIPEEQIPVAWVDAHMDSYSAVYDPHEGVRHVLYLK